MIDLSPVKKYLCGKGVSFGPTVNSVVLAPVFSQLPDNLYRPGQFIAEGSLDFAFSQFFINETKYYKILLKEWFDLLRIGANLVILYKPNAVLGADQLLSTIEVLFDTSCKVVKDLRQYEGNILIVKKLNNSKRVDGEMGSWTFGIITGGGRPQLVKDFIKSVVRQKIPNCEVIVSGKWSEDLGSEVTILDQSEAAACGHITRMKNAVCEFARNENIMIVHDRVVLVDGWYEGMKLYGNTFEALTCVGVDEHGARAGDWITLGGPRGTVYSVGSLDYADWDENVYIMGAVTILKKSIWKEVPWNEIIYWNQGEDIALTFDLRDKGYIARLNPYASTRMSNWRHGLFPPHAKDAKRLGSKQGMYVRRTIWFLLRVTDSVQLVRKWREFIFNKFIEKSRFKSFVVKN